MQIVRRPPYTAVIHSLQQIRKIPSAWTPKYLISKTADVHNQRQRWPGCSALRAIYAIKTNTFTLQTRGVISSCSQPALRTKGKTPLRLYNFSTKIQIVFHENLDSFFFKSKLYKCKYWERFLYNNDYSPPASLETPGKLQEQTLPAQRVPTTSSLTS